MAAEGAPLRAAVVGPGYIGAVHVEALRRVGGEALWLVGRPGSDVAARAAALRVPHYTDRLADALDDPRVGVVHVCTPNALHYPMARAVLERGKHLVCEKPLTTSVGDAAELVRLAAERDLVAAVAYCYRYYPLVRQARHLVTSGALGRIHHVRGLYLADELLHDDYLYYRFAPEIAGPSLTMADVGIHWCDLVEHVTGQRIVELLADVQTVIPQRVWRRDAPGAGPPPAETPEGAESHTVAVNGEDCLSLLLRFDGGAHGTLTASQVSAGHKNWITLSLDGAQGGLEWNQEQPNTLTIRRPASSEVLPKDPTLLAPQAAALARFPGGHPEGYPDAFRNLIGAVYGAITRQRAGAAPSADYPTLADGYRSIQLLDATLQSAHNGRWIAVP